ncbi:MAG TPA: Na+/H+ antiporter subunit E [Ilumatobacter sp.]|nr:Na+/H+ antiporter subunit E [Ilumatobacter sp.]
MRPSATSVIRITVLTVVWLALWSDLSVANVASGLLVAGLIVVTFDTWRAGTLALRPLRATRFGLFFLYKLVESSVVVARTAIAPRDRISTGIIAVPLRGCSDAVATLVADAISLTPGTLTLEVRRDPLTLYVHVLDTRDVEQVQRDIRTLEILAVRAFGDAHALAGLASDDTTSWRTK